MQTIDVKTARPEPMSNRSANRVGNHTHLLVYEVAIAILVFLFFFFDRR